MPKHVNVSLVDKMRFHVRTGDGHEFEVDARPEVGGDDSAASPMDLQLTALVGCGAMDVISILRKMRQDVQSYDVEATGEQAKEHPQKYTHITVTHRIRGRDIDEGMVRRALFLSMTRYCPVFAMLSPTVEISGRYEIADPSGAVTAAGSIGLDDQELTQSTAR
jgi:putative redox protein